ncbi:MAG: iron-sulfur cluster assembly accessory protein [Alphaproteobacteria bacterium]|nr:iron-sulfur cluster assembly accessory protein [Alphaproteobacteria bacterium]
MSDAATQTPPKAPPAAAAPRALPPLMRLTEAAVARLKALIAASDRPDAMLRIGVKPRGCSGMSYTMDYVQAPQPGDEAVTDQGVTVLVDRKATLFLIGTVMDYESDKLQSGFVFRNPNEKGRCGCGESFHV